MFLLDDETILYDIADTAECINMISAQNFINNEFTGTSSTLDSIEPSTGEVWAKIPDSGDAEVAQAYQAAKDAFVTWVFTRAFCFVVTLTCFGPLGFSAWSMS